MVETRDVLRQMFASLLKVSLDDDVLEQITPVVEGIHERLVSSLELETVEAQRRLRIALCGILAHGWAMGLSPFNTPNSTLDGAPLEVRVSRDILVPLQTLKSLRHVKKDQYGRVEKAFFEPGAEGRMRESIDRLLTDLSRRHWPDS